MTKAEEIEAEAKRIEISTFGQRLEKTGAREVGIIMLFVLALYLMLILFIVPSTDVSNYDGITTTLIASVFTFNLGAFALKTYSGVQEQRTRVIAARNPRLPSDGEVPIAG